MKNEEILELKAKFFEKNVFYSAPWNKMTESEQTRLINTLLCTEVKGVKSEKSINMVLNACYKGFLSGLSYQALNWRDN